ncbi:phosphoribosyltransferase [Pseudomonas chlororaphis]|uniref:Phosphoribosyl transferase n=1 Tax=Pseudomonas chlororaphis TaxID=587753 RepID=A0A1Q8EPH2_9PSED|nr:phosphoribosyltransferase [Pseudomonas chlororaphis]OLF53681.1 phosphoribosyl transferase [Pseudomonas chlororaphis]
MSEYPSLQMTLRDRQAAGQGLVEALHKYRGRPDVIVLALPRGGVPVAWEIARALDVRLELMLVRKLGVPGHEELAMGAIASGGIRLLNQDVLHHHPVSDAQLQAVTARETQELRRREQAYRGARAAPELRGQVLILVDDGLATGASMHAAVQAARLQHPARIVVAVPLAPQETVDALGFEVDELICPITPLWFVSIGTGYVDFTQTSDREVIELLQRAWQRPCEGRGG